MIFLGAIMMSSVNADSPCDDPKLVLGYFNGVNTTLAEAAESSGYIKEIHGETTE